MKKSDKWNRRKKKRDVIQFHVGPCQGQQTSGRARWMRLAVCYAALLLLGFGLIRMYGDVFTEAESAGKASVAALVLFAALFVAGYEFFPKKKYWNFILLLAFVGYGAVRFRALYQGLTAIVNEILQFINDYYTVQIPLFGVQTAGAVAEPAKVTEILLFLLGLLLWQMAYGICRKRNLILVLCPGLLILFGELLVGYAPQSLGVFCFVTGAVVCAVWCTGKRAEAGDGLVEARTREAAVVSTLLVVICAITAVTGAKASTTIIAKQSQMLAYQQYLERSVAEFHIFSYLQGESGKVNNHTPYYLGKEVLEVSVEKQMRENVYLRGYVGDTYQSGTWKNHSKKAFADEVASWSESDEQKAGFEILNLLYTSQKQSKELERGTYTISYVAPGNQYAYFPYYTRDNAAQEEMSVSADAMIFRKKQQEITINGIYNQSLFTVLENSEYAEETPVQKEYQNYVKRYLELPDNLPELDHLGEEMRARLDENGLEDGSLLKAVAAVSLVRSEINTRVSYSKNLERVPVGADVVENFLFQSGKGYCTHYASAGVLLLRELGIPARYVSGYVVGKDEFQKREDGRYTARVLDSDAHAWVEIYVSGIGWIPVEMIEGVDTRLDSLQMISSTDGSSGIMFEDSQNHTQIYALGKTVSEGGLSDWLEEAVGQKIVVEEETDGTTEEADPKPAADSETEKVLPTEQPDTEAAFKTAPSEGEKGQQKNIEGNQEENVSQITTTQKVVIAVVILAAVAGVAGVMLVYMRKKRIAASFMQENHRKAVQSITTQMYRILRKKGAFTEKEPDDVDFVNALLHQNGIFTEEEVADLCKIMEEAAFGRKEITGTDVRFCHKMYRKLLK